MKIGILTFHFADNYGAVLQAYALQSFIKKNGFEYVKIINYVSEKFESAYEINPFKLKGVSNRIKGCLKFFLKVNQRRKFKDFRKNKLGINDVQQNNLQIEGLDKIIVGSDQVWNLDITSNDLSYFLPCKKNETSQFYTYAASSNDGFTHSLNKIEMIQLLHKFSAISVREKQLKTLLESEYSCKCSLVGDPVFLHERTFWEKNAKKVKRLPNKYILLYILKRDDKLQEIACKLSKEKECEIIVIHPTAQRLCKIGKLLYNVGPQEFISLIMNAEIVVSNSFHAFAFSCIFSKTIYFDYFKETSNRVSSLISTLNIKIEEDTKIGSLYVNQAVYGDENYMKLVNMSKQYITENILDVIR